VKARRLYEILTDIAHICGGGLAGYVAFSNIYISVFYTTLYFTYQILEHLEVREGDFVGDLREFLAGFTAALALRLARII
jgi:hypothetical protein